jgi:hypothetical protein
VDEVVAEIVPNTQPDFTLGFAELRLGRRVAITRRLSRRSTAGVRERCEGGRYFLHSNPDSPTEETAKFLRNSRDSFGLLTE